MRKLMKGEAMREIAYEVQVKKGTIEAIEIILSLYYIIGDMTSEEALAEIAHLIYPESSLRPSNQTARKEE